MTSTVLSLVLVTLFKTLLVIITFGTSVPAGIFIPSMTVGASFGRIIGIFAKTFHQVQLDNWYQCPAEGLCITPGTYAMVGAAATLAGVTRMTVSLVVIMLELTGAMTYVLPVMIAVMVAKWVADALEPEGIYDALIRLRGYPFLDSREVYKGNALLREIMTPTDVLRVIPASGLTLEDLDKMLKEEPQPHVHGYPVVADKISMRLLGYIGRPELLFALERCKQTHSSASNVVCRFTPLDTQLQERKVLGGVGDLISPLVERFSEHPRPSTSTSASVAQAVSGRMDVDLSGWMDMVPMMMSSRMPVEIVLELFRKLGLRYLLVCHRGTLEGIVTKKDLLRHLDSTRAH